MKSVCRFDPIFLCEFFPGTTVKARFKASVQLREVLSWEKKAFIVKLQGQRISFRVRTRENLLVLFPRMKRIISKPENIVLIPWNELWNMINKIDSCCCYTGETRISLSDPQ